MTGIQTVLQPDLLGFPGAVSVPWVSPLLIEPLERAAESLRSRRGSPEYELVLWEGYRSPETHAFMLKRTRELIASEHPDLPEGLLADIADGYAPAGTPDCPASTGGAVAVTLVTEGAYVEMGCGFAEGGERALADFFRRCPPTSERDRSADYNRKVLAEAMRDGGFVQVEDEWWSYEYGTKRWARPNNRDALLDEVLTPPVIVGPSARLPLIPPRVATLHAGTAQPFLSVEEAHAAALTRPRGHLYARLSHPSGDQLARLLSREVFKSDATILTTSGKSAALHAVRGLMEPKSTLAYASDIYHECKHAFHAEGRDRDWHVGSVGSPLEVFAEGAPHVDVLYLDSPSNWEIRTFDLEVVVAAAKKVGTLVIVDVTLQPMQPALEAGVDVVVSSLSKDIALGQTVAGAIASRDGALLAKIQAVARHHGDMISPETAHVVYQQAVSLRDRLEGQLARMTLVEAMLRGHPAIRAVNVPDDSLLGDLRGSQLSFKLHDETQGFRLERVVGHRSHDPHAALNLACTFGTTFTSLEHLGSRLGKPLGLPVPTSIDRQLVRVGLGYEDRERVCAELRFALNASMEPGTASPSRRSVHSAA